LRVSDQRIAEVSKLPETTVVPSGETASARTGPPWPRNCACAGLMNITGKTNASNRRVGKAAKQRAHVFAPSKKAWARR
jgi:hypothetical protein